MTTVGLVGLGIMGSAMAGHLLAAGHSVVGHDVAEAARQRFVDAGGTPVDGAGEVARRADVIITSLPTVQAALDVCAEVAAAREGVLVVETSTLTHEAKRECRQRLVEAAGDLLDCPLSGTGAQALERDVVVFGSGDHAAFERVRPVLSAFSRSVRYLGPFGLGSTMKLVANLLVAVHNAATAEAFALGEAAGLDPQVLYDAIRDGAGNSVIFERRGRLMVERAYEPPTAKISMFVKDTALIADFAQQARVATPLLDVTRGLYDRAVERGLAQADAAALLEVVGELPEAGTDRPGGAS